MGLVGGSLAGLVIIRERKGFGWGGIWDWVSPELSSAVYCSGCWVFSIDLDVMREVVAAFVGSLIVLAANSAKRSN